MVGASGFLRFPLRISSSSLISVGKRFCCFFFNFNFNVDRLAGKLVNLRRYGDINTQSELKIADAGPNGGGVGGRGLLIYKRANGIALRPPPP